MVGSGTALADDPDLNARRAGRVVHRPVRILVDSRLRVLGASSDYLLLDATAAAGEVRVGDEVAVDHIGEPPFEGPECFFGGFDDGSGTGKKIRRW